MVKLEVIDRAIKEHLSVNRALMMIRDEEAAKQSEIDENLGYKKAMAEVGIEVYY